MKNVRPYAPLAIALMVCLCAVYYTWYLATQNKGGGVKSSNLSSDSSVNAFSQQLQQSGIHNSSKRKLKVVELERMPAENVPKTSAFRELQKQMQWHEQEGQAVVTSEGEKVVLLPPRISVSAAQLNEDGSVSINCFNDPNKLEVFVSGESKESKYVDF